MRFTRVGLTAVAIIAELGACARPSVPPLAPLRAGDRVRITAPAALLNRVVGTLARIDPDSLVVDRVRLLPHNPKPLTDTVRVALPIRTVQTLEVSAGRKGNAFLGSRIGALVGFVGGVAYGLKTPIHCNWAASGLFSLGAIQCISAIGGPSGWVLIHGMFGGAAGGMIGGAIGWGVRTESWHAVPLVGQRITITPLPGDRIGLGASLAF
jgi:hypothetical protein